jgi:hypothetical protein
MVSEIPFGWETKLHTALLLNERFISFTSWKTLENGSEEISTLKR